MRKRSLKDAEILDILKDVPTFITFCVNDEMKEKYLNYITNHLSNELKKIKTYPSLIPEIKKNIEKFTKNALVQPGESVGVICAQSIGERQTQLTLNSFHQAGLAVATVTTGVPRFLEILNATKEPKATTNTFLLKPDINNVKEGRRIIGNSLKYLRFKDLIEKETIHLEKDEEPWYDSFELFYSGDFRSSSSCISFKLKKEILYEYSIYLYTIKEKLEDEFEDINVVFSPLHYLQVDIFIDLNNIVENMQEEYSIAHEAGENMKEHVYVSSFLKEVLLPKIRSIMICGIDKIRNFYISLQNDRIKIDTEGCEMYKVLCLPYIDKSTVKTNHMWEALDIVGIEGVRKFIIDELIQIVSSDGTYINPCHLLLLADLMTFYGYIQSISRYGVKKDITSVLTRSSFEESLDHFSKASFFGENEKINSVSASIMCGKRSNIGSGKVNLQMDLDKIF